LRVGEPVLRVDAAGQLHYDEDIWRQYDLQIEDQAP